MRTLSLLSALLFTGCNGDRGFSDLIDPPSLSEPPAPDSFERQDRAVQRPRPAVDVLFVIDDSCSMDAEQQRLVTNFPTFTNYFQLSGIDYHIGVISTDMDNPQRTGRLRRAQGYRWIDRDTPNPNAVFSAMALVGTGGSADEAGRAAVYTALELLADSPRNVGFEREEAELHVIFISDEDDSSPPSPVPRSEFRQWLQAHKASPDMVKTHALIWPNGQSCPDGYSVGSLYERYASWTDGIVDNICDADWTPFMDAIGLETAGLKTEFFLKELPELDPWSLTVRVETERDGQTITLRFDTCAAGEGCDVEYISHRNSVVFMDFIPSPMDQVYIDYTRR